jgi:formylglycine-generating enzyme required for sulfatase activity
MGDVSGEGRPGERPVHTVYLNAFHLDIYEVTNIQYARFLNEYGRDTDDAGHKLLNISGKYCLIEKVGHTYKPKDGHENHPVVGVSWYGAAAYARFYGKRLPTEAEWEKAARGGLAGRNYPRENNISQDDANYAGIGDKDEWSRTSPVGSFAPNGYGLYNMAGNVSDWCADWYDPDYYARSPKQNPQGPDSGNSRVIRGGGWHFSDPYYLRVAYRSSRTPSDTFSYIGFRCVASRSD